MGTVSRYIACGIIAAAGVACAPAQATTQIGDGTVSIVGTYSPVVDLTSSPHTYTADNGGTFEITGTGGFAGVAGHLGTMDGVINFSGLVGTTIAQSLADFFVFDDGHGGTFNFSLESVKTVSYAVSANSSAIGLYLLGSTLDSNLDYGATPTSLTLTFNSTNNSAYSASATLSVPPSPTTSVPEPATWAFALMGFGMMGAAMRRRPRTSVSFA